MNKFSVDISHLDENELLFFGYDLVGETDEFFLYLHVHTNTEHIVKKGEKRLLVVDDLNDAQQMQSAAITLIPDDPATGS